jgi:hypothetical protein
MNKTVDDNENNRGKLVEKELMEQVTRQKVIEYLVEDIFSNPKLR